MIKGKKKLICSLEQFFALYWTEDGYVRMFLRGRPVTMHIPDQLRESYSLDQKAALTDRKLKLQWVYPWYVAHYLLHINMLPSVANVTSFFFFKGIFNLFYAHPFYYIFQIGHID